METKLISNSAAPTDSTAKVPRADSGSPRRENDSATEINHHWLIEQLLDQQQDLSAVEAFALTQEAANPAQAQYYSRLLPTHPPGPGQQYAFEVELDRCSGCKACVTACHTLNGLDEQETWRDVGLLFGGTASSPVMQHVTTACHHCLEPACMIACPVNAYEKDPTTGIVKHLDDQCFGCQYCTLACPYDVPKYHAGKGIVRKCDMCSERLEVGEAPACVQACPHEAISITLVETQQVIEDSEASHFLPAAPDPQLTLPTTIFRTDRVFPRNMLPADYYAANPQHAHWPLIIMLVLTQMSIGAFLTEMILGEWLGVSMTREFRGINATTALLLGLLALGASTMHLGRPQYAFRALLGLRHSWLSREILAFGLFAGTAFVFAIVCWAAPFSFAFPIVGTMVAISGFAGLFCSVMIYVYTGREFWNLGPTLLKFSLTGTILGIAATWLSLLCYGLLTGSASAVAVARQAGLPLVQWLIVATTVKLAFEAGIFRHLLSRRQTPMKRTARLMSGPLSRSTIARFACGFLGGIAVPALIYNEIVQDKIHPVAGIVLVSMLFLACLIGEILERYQFFAACSAARMPGRLNP